MSIDAMKQALHVFKEIYEGLGNVKKSDAHKDTKELATFVRKDCNFAMKDLTQAIEEAEKQKPVCPHIDEPLGCYRVRCQLGRKCVERTWVGLTDDEVWDAYEKGMYEEMWFARAIEAKLREKNG